MILNRRGTVGVIGVLVMLAVTSAHGQHSARFTTFQQYWAKAREAHSAGKYEEAAENYERATQLLGFEPAGRFNLACCLAMSGAIDGAIASATEAVRYGWDDSERLRNEPELERLQGNPAFEEIIAQAEANYAEPVALYASEKVSATQAAPLLIVLHGMGDNPRAHMWYWTELADRFGLIVAAPRGIEPMAERLTYAWSRPGAKAADDENIKQCVGRITQAIQLATKRYRVDRDRIYLAGFSQGGSVALRMLGNNPKKFAGALAFGTVYQTRKTGFWNRANARRPIRVYLVVGALDPMKPHTDVAVQQLRQGGVAVQSVVVPGISHEMPENYLDYQTKGWTFLIGK
ncbi:MAG: alpha/beta hydrolase-fold protein [Phycisphaerae bacterium]